MEWLLAHADDASLDDPFTEEEAGEMKAELEAPPEPQKAPLTEEEKKEKLAKLEELRVRKRAERLAKEADEVGITHCKPFSKKYFIRLRQKRGCELSQGKIWAPLGQPWRSRR